MAVYGVCLSKKRGDLLIYPLGFASAVPVLPTVFCLLLKFCGREQEGEALGVNRRVREQRNEKGRKPFKPTFQRTPVTAFGSFFHSAYWEGFFHRGTDCPLKLPLCASGWCGNTDLVW